MPARVAAAQTPSLAGPSTLRTRPSTTTKKKSAIASSQGPVASSSTLRGDPSRGTAPPSSRSAVATRPPTGSQNEPQSKAATRGKSTSQQHRPAPSATTRKDETAPAASSFSSAAGPTKSHVPPSEVEAISQDALIAILKEGSSVTSHVLKELLRHLNVTLDHLSLQPLLPLEPVTDCLPSSSKLSVQTSRLCRLAFNAVMQALASLITAGWRMSAAEADKHVAPRPQGVLRLVDAFRIASRVLFAEVGVGKGSSNADKKIQMTLAVLKRIAALEVHAALPSELTYLHTQIGEQFFGACTQAGEYGTLSHQLLRFRCCSDALAGDTIVAIILDYQAVVLNRLQMQKDVEIGDLQGLVDSVGDVDEGVIAWLLRAQTLDLSESDPTFALLQRASYQTEKTLSSYVAKLEQRRPSDDQAKADIQRHFFAARKLGVQALLCNTFRDVPGQPASASVRRAALLQKVAKMVKIFWRECGSSRAALRRQTYEEAHALLEEIEKKLGGLDKDSPTEEKWTSMEAWADLVGTWKWLAKHNGDFETVDRLEGKKQCKTDLRLAESMKNPVTSSEDSQIHITAAVILETYNVALSQCSNAVILLDMNRSEGRRLPGDTAQALTKVVLGMQALERLQGQAFESSHAAVDMLKALEKLLRRCQATIHAWQPVDSKMGEDATTELVENLATMTLQASRQEEEKEVFLHLMRTIISVAMDALLFLRGRCGQDEPPDASDRLNSVLHAARHLLVVEFEFVSAIKNLEGAAQSTLARTTTFIKRYTAETADRSPSSSDSPVSDFPGRDILMQEAKALSSTASALGGRLYKEGRYAAAGSFMEPAAQLLQQAVILGWQDGAGGTALCSRWEHAAICFRAISKHRETLEALKAYFDAVPPAQWEELERIARLDAPAEVFREDGSATNSSIRSCSFAYFDWPKFGRNLRTLAETSIFDLLAQQSKSSAQGLPEILGNSAVPEEARLFCLEHILTSDWLENRMHIDGALEASEMLIETCCTLAQDNQRPVRRTRILLRDLELRVFGARRAAEARDIVEAVEQLLKKDELASDEGLRVHIPALRARLHFLSVLLVHRLDTTSTVPLNTSEELSTAVRLAGQSLKELMRVEPAITPPKAVPSVTGKGTSEAKKPESKNAKLAVSSKIKAVSKKREPLRKTSAPKQPSTPPSSSPATPLRKGIRNTVSETASNSVTPLRKIATSWCGGERLLALVELVCYQLIAYGHTLGSLDMLKTLRRLAGGNIDLWCRSTIAITKQYLSLGRAGKALAFISSAAKYCIGPQQSAEASSSTRFYFHLAQALTYSQSDTDSTRALTAYNEALEIGRSIERMQGKQARGSGLSRAFMKIDTYQRISAAADAYAALMLANGDLRSAVEAATHATGYATRAASVVALLMQSKTGGDASSSEQDPFVSPSVDPAQQARDAQNQSLQPLPLRSGNLKERSSGLASSSLPSLRIASAFWRVNAALLSAFQKLARLNEIRGTAAQADMFATEAVHLAEGLCLKIALAQSLLLRAELRLQLGKKLNGEADVARSLEVLSDVWLPEAAALACIKGDQFAKTPDTYEEAALAYRTGQATLKALDKAVAEIEQASPSSRVNGSISNLSPSTGRRTSGQMRSPRASLTMMTRAEVLLPDLQTRILRRQAWLLQMLGRGEESQEALERAQAIEQVTEASRMETHLLQGRIALQHALQQMQSDAVWGMIPEAAISIPALAQQGSVSNRDMTASSAACAKLIVSLLIKAHSAFSLALSASSQSSSASVILRHALQGLSLTATLQATMSDTESKSASFHRAMTLGSASTITLRREFSDAVWSKLEAIKTAEDKDPWTSARVASPRHKRQSGPRASSRSSTLAAGPVQAGKGTSRSRRAISEEPDESSDDCGRDAGPDGSPDQQVDAILQEFWYDRREQSSAEVLYDERPKNEVEAIPEGWTVVSISVSKERNAIVLTRRSGCAALPPVVFSLPIDRQARREGEEEELTIDAALQEMEDIVSSSNQLTSSAKNISDSAEMDARKLWWTGRRELDDRLKILCENIECRWLGPFKSTFMDPLPLDKQSVAMNVFRSAFDRIVKRLCFPSGTLKKGAKVKLDDAILQVVAGLSAVSVTDEELEDLLHYIADIHQFNGMPVAVDEADLDEITMDLRSALEDFRSACAKARTQKQSDRDHHIFLILDKDMAPIPWESIPCLRGRAVCRIPSMSFLQDRVEMARRLGASQDGDGAFHLSRECKTYYLLNPSGDLAKSQKRFEGYLRSIPNSRGLIGKPPGPSEYLDALSSNTLVLYFGHSGAEQYVKTARLRALQRCAVTMLWGCSSAVLRDQGEFDRTGTPYNYMIAGAPAVVGQLFDATDKELDCLSESVLLHLGLKQAPSEELTAAIKSSKARFELPSSTGMAAAAKGVNPVAQKRVSLARAVAESRDCCRLPYLTGSAPVVYGVPVYFDRD